MRYYCFILTMLQILVITPVCAESKINIFACEPEWASLAKEIGGDRVKAFSATTSRQDPHHIRARPSLIAAMRKADLVVCSGASLESGWLPILLEKAGNAKVQPGAVGYLEAINYVQVLEKPTRLDRSAGDIHPEGNSHVHLNPDNIALLAKELLRRLKAIDPVSSSVYQMRYDGFISKWQTAIQRWKGEGEGLRGVPVIVHHKSFTYLLDWLGMRVVGTLEAKPGIPPTSSHLESLLQTLYKRSARVIIRTPYESSKASKWLSKKTRIPAIILPFTVGGNEKSSDLFGLFDSSIALLKKSKND